MSTILDALRTLQRERESRMGPDVLDSALDVEAPSLPRRSRTPWIVLGALLAVAVPVALLYGIRGDLDLRGSTETSQTSTESSIPQLPTSTQLHASRPAAKPQQPASIAPAESRVEAAAPHPVEPAPALETRLEEPVIASAPAPPRLPSKPTAGVRPEATAGRPASPPGAAAASLSAVPSTRLHPSPAPKTRLPRSKRSPPRASRAVAKAETRAPRVEPRPTPLPLSVRQIRWHPDPERRSARIVRADGSSAEVHEGDIVEGALVRRISTDSIELAVGNERRRLALSR